MSLVWFMVCVLWVCLYDIFHVSESLETYPTVLMETRVLKGSLSFLWCGNSLYSSGKALQHIMEHCCEDLTALSNLQSQIPMLDD